MNKIISISINADAENKVAKGDNGAIPEQEAREERMEDVTLKYRAKQCVGYL